MSEEKANETLADQPKPMTWVEFLQDHPPGSFVKVTNAIRTTRVSSQGRPLFDLIVPDLQLHCAKDTCNANMFFWSEDKCEYIQENKWSKLYLNYLCRNCSKTSKIFALAIMRVDNKLCEAYKFGEMPHFGPPTPTRVITMIGPDRELFLQGRRCENQALGIGAFTYYRRVVEEQWGRLISQIIQVAEATRAKTETIALLEKAKQETQFSKSVEILKDAIPPALLINGHNPLVLLYGALSQGVHALSDEECLCLATSIRVILAELADKLSNALKDEREIKEAVGRLLQTSAKKKGEPEEQD